MHIEGKKILFEVKVRILELITSHKLDDELELLQICSELI